jgi:hypothetical protein
MTPVVYLDSSRTFRLRHTSRLRLRIKTPVNERAACLTTSAMKDFA